MIPQTALAVLALAIALLAGLQAPLAVDAADHGEARAVSVSR